MIDWNDVYMFACMTLAGIIGLVPVMVVLWMEKQMREY